MYIYIGTRTWAYIYIYIYIYISMTSISTLTPIWRWEPRCKYDCGLLRCTLPDSKRSVVAATISDEDVGSVVHVFKIWLWQNDFGKHSSEYSAPSAVGAQRCSNDHLRPTVQICNTLANLHWLCADERISFKLATQTSTVCKGSRLCPSLHFCQLHLSCWYAVLSTSSLVSTNGFIVRPSWLIVVGDRAFPVAGAYLSNSLPDELTLL